MRETSNQPLRHSRQNQNYIKQYNLSITDPNLNMQLNLLIRFQTWNASTKGGENYSYTKGGGNVHSAHTVTNMTLIPPLFLFISPVPSKYTKWTFNSPISYHYFTLENSNPLDGLDHPYFLLHWWTA